MSFLINTIGVWSNCFILNGMRRKTLEKVSVYLLIRFDNSVCQEKFRVSFDCCVAVTFSEVANLSLLSRDAF